MTRRERRGLLVASLLVGVAIWLLTYGDNLAANRIERGKATTYGPGYEGYLALPEGPGHRVRICSSESGSRRCLVLTSNDAGPTKERQRAGVVADLDVPTFEHLCGCGWRDGVIEVTVEYLGSTRSSELPRSRQTLPPTDTE